MNYNYSKNKSIKKLLGSIVVMMLIFVTSANAKHIIGGDLTYECLGGDNYEFTLKIYRDCNCINCADFDSAAAIGVYRCGGNVDCDDLSQQSTYLEYNAPLGAVTDVENPDYPCLIPPDVCVEQGVYKFTLNLPQSQDSYHISYQRCCRNVTISNLVDPDDAGATYTIEVTPQAQQLCNNSPIINSFPPTVVCAGLPMEVDHSATDPDGDVLVYEFCAPLLGGGDILSGPATTSCIGVIPTPSCPPPYDEVQFLEPNYNPTTPMAGNPFVSINPVTGLITGTPTVQGQFVVGVCISEYRNGVLLSKVFRDFQFNVGSCEPTVETDMVADEVLPDKTYIYNLCGDSTINFINESYQQQYIDNFFWEFNIDGALETFDEWEPSITFPGLGQYTGNLYLNPNTACGDTANIIVNVFPNVESDFSFVYDTCVAGPVTFTDLSTTGSCCITEWIWNFDDGNISNQSSPQHLYDTPGMYDIALIVRDTNGCESVDVQPIEYFPTPTELIVNPSGYVVCQPATIFFDNLSSPISEEYNITWDFGDGNTSNEISPTHVYEEVGEYYVTLSVESPVGCVIDSTFDEVIVVKESPIADFYYTPESLTSLAPEVSFFDESSFATTYQWEFGDGKGAFIANPIHTYRDTGVYEVLQVVIHENGCRDTMIQYLDIQPEVRYYLPNAFTPNGDGDNDTYKGVGILDGATNFKLQIWDRWGELVFEGNHPDLGWNGRKNNIGSLLPSGVYVVLATYNEPRGELIKIKGLATLIK